MNNLLKIFLIFNLVSSATSSVNNFTLSLPETELTMGQNVSELVEEGRKEPYFPYLHGGMKVTGVSWVDNLPNQRPCTLSFPVYRTDDKTPGFLTSYLCGSEDDSGDIFVNGNDVGSTDQPYNLLSDPGLDYRFVEPNSDYWSDEISRKVDYSHCAKSGRGIVDIDEPLPILPTPSQPLSVGDKVYAHGGDSGTVHGVILETGVKISVWNPKSEDPFYLYDVVKVKMNKAYSDGNLGAPVYITLQIPNSKQFVASPVGQVVEIYGWGREWKSRASLIWYYIPINRILKDSGLTIASGDLSYLLPPNKTESSNDFMADDLVSGANISDINNLVSRQPNEPQNFLSGPSFLVLFSTTLSYTPTANSGQCTLGFAIRKNVPNSQLDIQHGFLTLDDCFRGVVIAENDVFSYYSSQQSPGELEQILIGSAKNANRKYSPTIGLNYLIVKILPNDATHIYWDDITSTKIPVPGEGLHADVIDRAFVPGVGARVCWWGSYSGHNCGEVVEPAATLIRLHPWVPLLPNYFQGLIKVRVDGTPPALRDSVSHDQGSPVYFPIREGDRIARVRPVGILLDYVREFENINDMCLPVWYMYCISVDKILLNDPELSLIGTPPHQ